MTALPAVAFAAAAPPVAAWAARLLTKVFLWHPSFPYLGWGGSATGGIAGGIQGHLWAVVLAGAVNAAAAFACWRLSRRRERAPKLEGAQ